MTPIQSKVWPGITLDTIDQVIDFENWLHSLPVKVSVRYIGQNLLVDDSLIVRAGFTLVVDMQKAWAKPIYLERGW